MLIRDKWSFGQFAISLSNDTESALIQNPTHWLSKRELNSFLALFASIYEDSQSVCPYGVTHKINILALDKVFGYPC